jgi:hypothetical protein
LHTDDLYLIFLASLLSASLAGAYLRTRDKARLIRLEGKLDLLLKRAGLTYTPGANLPPEDLATLQEASTEAAAERQARRDRPLVWAGSMGGLIGGALAALVGWLIGSTWEAALFAGCAGAVVGAVAGGMVYEVRSESRG